MSELISWFNAYPSRIMVTEWFIILVLYVILTKCKRRKTPINKRRFVYCENGRKSNIVYVDLVSQYEFDHHDEFVWYPIIDMNNSSIYFALPPYDD